MEKNISVRPWPEPWQYRGWVSSLKTELARLVAPYGKEAMQWLSGVFRLDGDANSVPDEALQHSEEFPKLDVLLAIELMNCAEQGCPSVYIRMESLRDHRLNAHSLISGREVLRFIVRYVRRNSGASEANFGWMELREIALAPGKLAEFIATWDFYMSQLRKPPPPGFLLKVFKEKVQSERLLSEVTRHFNTQPGWTGPHDDDCQAACDWLRSETSTVLDVERERALYEQQGNLFGRARNRVPKSLAPATSVDRGRKMSRGHAQDAEPPRSQSSYGNPESERKRSGDEGTELPIAYSRPASTRTNGRRFSESRKPGDRPSLTPDGGRRFWRPGDASKSPGGTRNIRHMGTRSRSPRGTNRPRGYWDKDPRKGFSSKPGAREGNKSSLNVDSTGSSEPKICFEWLRTSSCRKGQIASTCMRQIDSPYRR